MTLDDFLAEKTLVVNDCLIWQGSTDTTNRYGRVSIKRPEGWRVTPAHRHVWTLLHGEIPPRHDIHHLCGNRLCVRPEHLECLSRSEHRKRHARFTMNNLPALRADVESLEEKWGIGISHIHAIVKGHKRGSDNGS